MADLTHISDFLGLRKSTVGLLFMVILVGMGERVAERFLPIYLIALGGSLMGSTIYCRLSILFQEATFQTASAPNEHCLFSISLPCSDSLWSY